MCLCVCVHACVCMCRMYPCACMGECVIQHTVVDETPGLPLEHVGGAIVTAGTERGRERSHQ